MGPRPRRRGTALNHAKLDAALAAALERRGGSDRRDLVVFVEHQSGAVSTATLSAGEVDALSERAEVRRLRLARRLRATGDG